MKTQKQLPLRPILLIGIPVLIILAIIISVNVSGSDAKTLKSVEEVLTPFMNQYQELYTSYEQRYSKLETDYNDLLNQYGLLQKALSDANQATTEAQNGIVAAKQETANYYALSQQLTKEVATAKSALQTMTDQRAQFEQRYLQSQAEVARLQGIINSQSEDYSELYNKLVSVNNGTDPTVNDYSDSDRAIFYNIWNKWWEVKIVEQ